MSESEVDPIEDVLRAQKIRTQQARARLEVIRRTLEGDADARTELAVFEPLPLVEAREYEDLVRAARSYLREQGRLEENLEDVLQPDDLALLRHDGRRMRWTSADMWTVGFAALLGSFTVIASSELDAIAQGGLDAVKGTDMLDRWETATKGLPIDYGGAGVGGPAHRVTSAGHDIGRPVKAIRQIMDGEYRGTAFYTMAGKQEIVRHGTTGGTPFDAYSLAASLLLWVTHLATDFVTPTSLPLPGWTKLYAAAPSAQVADVFRDLYYAGDGTPGLNMRSLTITKSVPWLVTEVVIRSSLAWTAHTERGHLRLDEPEQAKRDEMRLAAHGVVTSVMTGRVLFDCYTTSSPLGLRHINPQLVTQTAVLGVRVLHQWQQRREAEPATWAELAAACVAREPAMFSGITIAGATP